MTRCPHSTSSVASVVVADPVAADAGALAAAVPEIAPWAEGATFATNSTANTVATLSREITGAR